MCSGREDQQFQDVVAKGSVESIEREQGQLCEIIWSCSNQPFNQLEAKLEVWLVALEGSKCGEGSVVRDGVVKLKKRVSSVQLEYAFGKVVQLRDWWVLINEYCWYLA